MLGQELIVILQDFFMLYDDVTRHGQVLNWVVFDVLMQMFSLAL